MVKYMYYNKREKYFVSEYFYKNKIGCVKVDVEMYNVYNAFARSCYNYMQTAHKMWCKGGCAEERTIEVERENIRKFVKKWGNAVYESNRKRTKNNYVFPKVKISAFGLK